MTIRRISDAEMFERLRHPYNQPAIINDSDRAAFRAEWFGVQQAVENCLNRFGERDDSGEADYCLSEDWSFSRGISITVTRKGFLTGAVVNDLHQLLTQLRNDYEIFATHFLEDEPHWGVFLNKCECLVCAESFEYFPGLATGDSNV